jgi:hypothetical protein
LALGGLLAALFPCISPLSLVLSRDRQHTILAVLCAQILDLLLRQALLFCYLEMLERLCRRLDVCILHASS